MYCGFFLSKSWIQKIKAMEIFEWDGKSLKSFLWLTNICSAKNSLKGAISVNGKDWEVPYWLESVLNCHPWVVKVPIIPAVFSGSPIRKTELASSSLNEGLGFILQAPTIFFLHYHSFCRFINLLAFTEDTQSSSPATSSLCYLTLTAAWYFRAIWNIRKERRCSKRLLQKHVWLTVPSWLMLIPWSLLVVN